MECAIALTIGSQKKHLTRTAAEAMSGHIMRKMVRINGHVRSHFPTEPARRSGGIGSHGSRPIGEARQG
jgi:hypothetical protein